MKPVPWASTGVPAARNLRGGWRRPRRRKQPMAAFQTLLGLGTGRTPTPYRRIRGWRDMLTHLQALNRKM